MKLGPLTKLDNLTRETKHPPPQKKIENDVMSNFLIYDQFGAIQKPHSGCIVRKTFYLAKTENRTEKSLTQLPCYCFM